MSSILLRPALSSARFYLCLIKLSSLTSIAMAPTIKLYGDFFSPFTIISLFTLHEKGLPYEHVDVKLFSHETKV